MNYDDQQMSSYLEMLFPIEQFSSDELLPDFEELAPSQNLNAYGTQLQQQEQHHQENNQAAFQELTNFTYYDSASSPPLSTVSNSSTVFTFPTPAPTPEAALPLAESLVETPNIDISLFGPNFRFKSENEKDAGVFDSVNVIPTDTSTVHVKEELATHIRQRRRASGLPEEVAEDAQSQTPKNELTKADVIRRERRKASNRRAATKCRLKKKVADDQMQQAMQRLRDENSSLRKEVEDLTNSRKALEDRLNGHLAICPHHQR